MSKVETFISLLETLTRVKVSVQYSQKKKGNTLPIEISNKI